jgi:glycosyltransferase involved in cell wall biosynthesis
MGPIAPRIDPGPGTVFALHWSRGMHRDRLEGRDRVATDVRRPRLLVVGPLPPPMGGVQHMNAMLIHSSLACDYEIHTVDTSRKVLRWAVERNSWLGAVDAARFWARLVVALVQVRPHAVYVHAASDLVLLRDGLLMLTARLAMRPVVCHYHGTLHTRFPSPRTRFGRFAGRTIMRAAHRVIVLGPTYREGFAAAWGRDDLEWSPNLADVALYREAPGRRPAWLGDGERAVLFVGRLSAPKGLLDLFDAAPAILARHPATCFVLCGVAESEARERWVRSEVARRGIATQVRFLGPVEGAEMAHAYAAATLLAVPSWTEGFPLVIPEAMAAGVPVVASAVGAIPDFIRDGEDGFLIPPHNPAALADRVGRLLGDEALRHRMAEHVRARAAGEFDVEVGAARVRQVLGEALGLRAGAWARAGRVP